MKKENTDESKKPTTIVSAEKVDAKFFEENLYKENTDEKTWMDKKGNLVDKESYWKGVEEGKAQQKKEIMELLEKKRKILVKVKCWGDIEEGKFQMLEELKLNMEETK